MPSVSRVGPSHDAIATLRAANPLTVFLSSLFLLFFGKYLQGPFTMIISTMEFTHSSSFCLGFSPLSKSPLPVQVTINRRRGLDA